METNDFLAGGGVMGARIRAHDWRHSPLGPIGSWPQSLRTALGIVLNSAFPTYLAWGPQLTSLYNDAYRPILGTKPEALGRPFPEVWTEAWSQVGPITERALRGEASYFEDLALTVNRHGVPEQTWWTFAYSPVRDESGSVQGVLCTVHETTERVLTERRLRFLMVLSERLRSLANPRAVVATTAQMLGRHLGVGRAGYGEVDTSGALLTVEEDWTAESSGMPSYTGRHRLDDFGKAIVDELRAGRAIRLDDAFTDPRTAGADKAAVGVRAGISVPLIHDGRIVATLYAHANMPRRWHDNEVILMREVVARTWEAVGRARAEAALRLSEEQFRQLANLVPAFVWIGDPNGRLRFINDRWYEYTGQTPEQAIPDGWVEALDPENARDVSAAWESAVQQGIPFEAEHPVRRSDGQYRWYLHRALPLHDAAGAITGWFGMSTDVHQRKLQEEQLQQFAEHSANVLWMFDLGTSQVEYLSSAVEQVWGVPAQTLRSVDDWIATIHVEDREGAREALRRVTQGEVVVREYRIVRPSDGSVRCIRDTFFPIRDEQGRVRRAGGIAQDLTGRIAPRVYVVDGVRSWRQELVELLQAAGYEVRAFASVRGFLEVASSLLAGCVVLNTERPEAGGLTVVKELKANRLILPVLVVGASGAGVRACVQAMKAGAVDFVERPYEPEALLLAVAAALVEIRPVAEREKATDFTRIRIAALTVRERQVLELLLAGGTNKSIARELGLSPRTVENHRARVMEALGAQSLTEAVLVASAAGVQPATRVRDSRSAHEP